MTLALACLIIVLTIIAVVRRVDVRLVLFLAALALGTLAGQPLAIQPVINEEDPYGNLETGDNSTVVTAALSSGTGPLQGTSTTTLRGGVATFTNLADNRAESVSLRFSSAGLTSATSTNILVSTATASKLVVHTQPSATATAGQAFGVQPVVYLEDQFIADHPVLSGVWDNSFGGSRI